MAATESAVGDEPVELHRSHKETLLRIARQAIISKLARGTAPSVDLGELDAPLREEAGAFVSLIYEGELRGCIGSVHASGELASMVAEMAVHAATSDPRFSVPTATQLSHTDIEVSVLSELTPAAPEDVVAGVHGLFVAHKNKRGVLLPQVATQFEWDRTRFLAEACKKAGLPEDAWNDDETLILVFKADVFSDRSLMEEEEEEEEER